MSKLLDELVKEMAITSANSIAANPGGSSEPIRRRDIKGNQVSDWKASSKQDRADRAKMHVNPEAQQKLELARQKMKKKKSVRAKLMRLLGLGESQNYDMNDVSSRLKDIDKAAEGGDDTVTYGVEDDEGNLMKITVRSDQASDFEERLSKEIHDNAEFSNEINDISGKKPDKSMAEVLFRLKDEFDIVDVEFPEIPKNAVYKTAGGMETNTDDGLGKTDLENDLDYENDIGMGDLDQVDDLGADTGDVGDPLDGDLGDMGDEDTLGYDGEDSDGDNLGVDDEFTDDESVSDFSNPEKTPESPEGLLQQVLKMLTKDAEAKQAQAEAEAEKARAEQAEYAAKAANASIQQQTELLSMEEKVKRQKDKEKEAKKIADLAKYRVQQTNGIATESHDIKVKVYKQLLKEFDELDSPNLLVRQRGMLNIKYKILPTDDPATQKYKRDAKRAAMRELQAKLMAAKSKQAYDASRMQKTKDDNDEQLSTSNNMQQQKPGRPRPNVAQVPQGPSNIGSMR